MKKHSIVSLVLATAGSLALSAPLSATEYKIGTIDMKQVFDNYYKTKEQESKINEARTQAQKELADRMETFTKAQEEARKLNDEASKPELAEKAKAEKSKLLSDKLQALGGLQREIQEFQQTREKQLTEQQVRSRNTLLEEINKVVESKIKGGGFDFVFDKSGQSLNAVPFLVFAKDSFDLTAEVSAELNKGKEVKKK
jgi:outer membrane protein